jgi:anthranilate phosphoribosyltransferase
MKELLNAILDRKDLTPAQAQQLLNALIDPATTPAQVGAALAALRTKGETYQEIAGLATAMRSAAIDPSLDQGPGPHTPCIDIVGTGGDGAQTLNISTAAALLLAAAGASPTTNTRPWRVIKHGNRAISSACGSADVLAELGVPMPLAPAADAHCLKRRALRSSSPPTTTVPPPASSASGASWASAPSSTSWAH